MKRTKIYGIKRFEINGMKRFGIDGMKRNKQANKNQKSNETKPF